MTALDITGIGGVKLTQFLAAAGDRRSNSACSLLDKAPIIQSAVEGFIHISDIANVLASSGIAITPEKLLFLASAADITIVDNLMRLQDLEVYSFLHRLYDFVPFPSNPSASLL